MVSAIRYLPTDLSRTHTITKVNDMSTIWRFDASTSPGGSFDVVARELEPSEREAVILRINASTPAFAYAKNHAYHPDIRAGGGRVMTGATAFMTSSAWTAMTPAPCKVDGVRESE
jgi:hypothetical protein